jgi:glyoxylase-like metal-dependent hydrolase (beta-lactamase superfamily II)
MSKGADLWMPRTGWLMARMLTLDVQETPTRETLQFYTRAGMDTEELARRKSERPFNFADCVVPLPLGYNRLQDGHTITMGGRTWDIRMGDGHAPEHATFWSRDDHMVIGGDQLLPSISANLGVYPTEPEADPVADWLTSCEVFQPFAHDDQLVLGGHKLPFTGLPLRLNQMIANHHGALARLMDHIGEPHAAGECFKPLFKRNIGPAEYGLALVEAVAHLNHLHQTGQATRVLREDGAWVFQAV